MTTLHTPVAASRRGGALRRPPRRRRSRPLASALAVVLLLAALIAAVVASPAATKPKPPPPPQPPTGGASGTWTRTGDMITPRHSFSGALLADGRVLVAGGLLETQDRTGTERSELYDAATGRWSATGSLPTPVFGPSLTRLNDGRVLAAGGSQAGYITVAVRDAQLFDPAKGTWTATGSMREQRGLGHVAVLLADGRVLAVRGGYFAGAEVYDRRTGTWSSTGPMIKQHVSDPTATLLEDGRVLVAGGSGAPAVAELYDPATTPGRPPEACRRRDPATGRSGSQTAEWSSLAGVRAGTNWPAPRSTIPPLEPGGPWRA